MGAQNSKPEGSPAPPSNPQQQQQPQEKLSLNQSLLNKITSHSPSSSPSPSASEKDGSSSSTSSTSSPLLSTSRQSHLDSSVRSAISSELSRLRKQEAEVTAQIQSRLEAENLAIEEKYSSKSTTDKNGTAGSSKAGRSSENLRKELEEVKQKISRHDTGRKGVENAPGVKEARKSVIECYKEVGPQRTLDCWKEVKTFADAVAKAERNYISSIST